MDIDNHLESQYRKIKEENILDPEFLDLYDFVDNEKLRDIFASLHKQYVTLFKLMNDRLPTRDHTAHFRADSSRSLMSAIDMTFGLCRSLSRSRYSFEIDPYYEKTLSFCQSFLRNSGGSTLPENMEKIELYYSIPIFRSSLSHKVEKRSTEHFYNLKLIGEGAYAQVFKYRDEYYNKDFVLKRAKPGLSSKELERFRREFEEMKNLSSPYIVEVYVFEASRNQYIMEYMDFSLDRYIEKFNNKLTHAQRKHLSFQILRAFKYLHSKNLIHRDISPKNILLKEYDDAIVVKVSDFGLVKTPNSNLTSLGTEFKGYFNDPGLMTEGFDRYNVLHETYALTKLLFFVMTGKTNTSEISDPALRVFVNRVLNVDCRKRYKDIEEITDAFRVFCNS